MSPLKLRSSHYSISTAYSELQDLEPETLCHFFAVYAHYSQSEPSNRSYIPYGTGPELLCFLAGIRRGPPNLSVVSMISLYSPSPKSSFTRLGRETPGRLS